MNYLLIAVMATTISAIFAPSALRLLKKKWRDHQEGELREAKLILRKIIDGEPDQLTTSDECALTTRVMMRIIRNPEQFGSDGETVLSLFEIFSLKVKEEEMTATLRRRAEQAQLEIPIIQQAPNYEISVGFMSPECTIHEELFAGNFLIEIGRRRSSVTLRFGKLRLCTEQSNMKYQRTFLIEIEVGEATQAHACKLPLNGFGSCLFQDYGEAGRELAIRFAETLGLHVYSELNHYPIVKLVVAELPEPEQKRRPSITSLIKRRLFVHNLPA